MSPKQDETGLRLLWSVHRLESAFLAASQAISYSAWTLVISIYKLNRDRVTSFSSSSTHVKTKFTFLTGFQDIKSNPSIHDYLFNHNYLFFSYRESSNSGYFSVTLSSNLARLEPSNLLRFLVCLNRILLSQG